MKIVVIGGTGLTIELFVIEIDEVHWRSVKALQEKFSAEVR